MNKFIKTTIYTQWNAFKRFSGMRKKQQQQQHKHIWNTRRFKWTKTCITRRTSDQPTRQRDTVPLEASVYTWCACVLFTNTHTNMYACVRLCAVYVRCASISSVYLCYAQYAANCYQRTSHIDIVYASTVQYTQTLRNKDRYMHMFIYLLFSNLDTSRYNCNVPYTNTSQIHPIAAAFTTTQNSIRFTVWSRLFWFVSALQFAYVVGYEVNNIFSLSISS